MGNHLGNWSRIHDSANHISHITEINHKGYASFAGVKIRNRKKKQRMTSLITITMRYGLIKLEDIGTLRHNGCLASAKLLGDRRTLVPVKIFYALCTPYCIQVSQQIHLKIKSCCIAYFRRCGSSGSCMIACFFGWGALASFHLRMCNIYLLVFLFLCSEFNQ